MDTRNTDKLALRGDHPHPLPSQTRTRWQCLALDTAPILAPSCMVFTLQEMSTEVGLCAMCPSLSLPHFLLPQINNYPTRKLPFTRPDNALFLIICTLRRFFVGFFAPLVIIAGLPGGVFWSRKHMFWLAPLFIEWSSWFQTGRSNT